MSSHEHIFADQCSNGQQDYVGLPEEDTNSLEVIIYCYHVA